MKLLSTVGLLIVVVAVVAIVGNFRDPRSSSKVEVANAGEVKVPSNLLVPVRTGQTSERPDIISNASADHDFEKLASENIARIDGLLKTFSDKKTLFNTLMKEKRDEQWASAAEKTIKQRYKTAIGEASNDRILDVYCGSQSCAVIGDLPPLTNSGNRQKLLQNVQSLEFVSDMIAKGYWSNGFATGASAADNRSMYMSFYRKGPAKIVRARNES